VPEALSTGGGLKTRQPLILVRSDAAGAQESLSLGWLDGAQRMGKVRPLASLERMFQTRHHQPISLDLIGHARLVGDLEEFCRARGIELGVLDEEPMGRPRDQGLGLWTILAIVVAAMAVGVWLARAL
jgi:hypothetical protein